MKKAPRHWLQPELWVMLGLPIAALLGGAATLWLVAGDLSADGEPEGARRTAQVQTAELGPDLVAAQRGLQGELRVDRRNASVRVSLHGDVGDADALQLLLVHPMYAARDLDLQLHPAGGEWSAALPPGAEQRWRLVLTDPARRWRLVGQLPAGAHGAQLRPALATP